MYTYIYVQGVVQQTIKDVNQSLVDDSLVNTDKIGAANFFWSFPSKVIIEKQTQKDNLVQQIKKTEDNIEKLLTDIDKCKEERKDIHRCEKLEKYYNLIQEEKLIDQQLEVNKKNDPVEINRVSKQSIKNMNGANRWTDNVFALKKWLMKKKGMSSNDVNRSLRIPSDFDNVTEQDVPKRKKPKN